MPLSCPVAPYLSESRAAQRRRRRWWWRGEESARRPGLDGQILRHVMWRTLRNALRHVLRSVLYVPVLHMSPKGSGGWQVCDGRGFRRWKMTRSTISTLKPPSSAAFTCPSFMCRSKTDLAPPTPKRAKDLFFLFMELISSDCSTRQKPVGKRTRWVNDPAKFSISPPL